MVQRKWPNEDKLVSTPAQADVQRCAARLDQQIRNATDVFARELLGFPILANDRPRWRAWQEAAEGTEDMVHLHLTRVRICREAKVDPTAEVLDARAAGATWSQIAAACGRTKQAVAVRWGAAAAEDTRQRQESEKERTRPEVSPLDQFDPAGVELPAPQAATPAQRTGQ